MIIESSKFFVGLLVVTPILLLLGCASSQYKDTSPYNEGDLVLGEIVITDNVKRVYGTQDLKSLGWNANDVEEVMLTRFKQQFRTFTKDPEPILGLHALVPPDLKVENGDVVVARAEISDSIDVHGTKFVIIQIIEKYNDTGKCYYQDTGRPSRYFRYGIWCKDLEKEGWQWNNDFFEKRVNPNLKTVTIANKIDGKVLVMMTLEQEEWVYSGHPTSFTGNDLTLAIPLANGLWLCHCWNMSCRQTHETKAVLKG